MFKWNLCHRVHVLLESQVMIEWTLIDVFDPMKLSLWECLYQLVIDCLQMVHLCSICCFSLWLAHSTFTPHLIQTLTQMPNGFPMKFGLISQYVSLKTVWMIFSLNRAFAFLPEWVSHHHPWRLCAHCWQEHKDDALSKSGNTNISSLPKPIMEDCSIVQAFSFQDDWPSSKADQSASEFSSIPFMTMEKMVHQVAWMAFAHSTHFQLWTNLFLSQDPHKQFCGSCNKDLHS